MTLNNRLNLDLNTGLQLRQALFVQVALAVVAETTKTRALHFNIKLVAVAVN